jgi:hypothetical protein
MFFTALRRISSTCRHFLTAAEKRTLLLRLDEAHRNDADLRSQNGIFQFLRDSGVPLDHSDASRLMQKVKFCEGQVLRGGHLIFIAQKAKAQHLISDGADGDDAWSALADAVVPQRSKRAVSDDDEGDAAEDSRALADKPTTESKAFDQLVGGVFNLAVRSADLTAPSAVTPPRTYGSFEFGSRQTSMGMRSQTEEALTRTVFNEFFDSGNEPGEFASLPADITSLSTADIAVPALVTAATPKPEVRGDRRKSALMMRSAMATTQHQNHVTQVLSALSTEAGSMTLPPPATATLREAQQAGDSAEARRVAAPFEHADRFTKEAFPPRHNDRGALLRYTMRDVTTTVASRRKHEEAREPTRSRRVQFCAKQAVPSTIDTQRGSNIPEPIAHTTDRSRCASASIQSHHRRVNASLAPMPHKLRPTTAALRAERTDVRTLSMMATEEARNAMSHEERFGVPQLRGSLLGNVFAERAGRERSQPLRATASRPLQRLARNMLSRPTRAHSAAGYR